MESFFFDIDDNDDLLPHGTDMSTTDGRWDDEKWVAQQAAMSAADEEQVQ
jgi:hypothetical protein